MNIIKLLSKSISVSFFIFLTGYAIYRGKIVIPLTDLKQIGLMAAFLVSFLLIMTCFYLSDKEETK